MWTVALGVLTRFGGWLLGGFLAIAPTLVGKILVALGVGVASYTGMDASLGWLKSQAVSSLLGLPVQVVGMLALMRVGSCISMVFSAILIKLALDGMVSGVLKKWVKV
jgi:hypothetical protein